jgi:endonuclease/exonuclease/phosphatase family metal-dependent hydrolase
VVAAVVLVCGLFPSASAAAGPAGLRVLAYNIHTGIGMDGTLDLARTADVITASRADIVGLEEVDVHWAARSGYADEARELARLTGMHVYFAPIYDLDPEPGHAERRQYGVALLSRYPILAAWNHQLTRLSTVDPNPVPAPAPGFGEVLVATPDGPVHAYVTHLDYRPEPSVRRTQVAETVRILDEDRPGTRQVLLGDFNAEPAAPELAPLLSRMSDAWARVNGSGGGQSYPAGVPDKRIDYVTYAGPLRPRAASVPDTLASDHRPVLTEFR